MIFFTEKVKLVLQICVINFIEIKLKQLNCYILKSLRKLDMYLQGLCQQVNYTP